MLPKRQLKQPSKTNLRFFVGQSLFYKNPAESKPRYRNPADFLKKRKVDAKYLVSNGVHASQLAVLWKFNKSWLVELGFKDKQIDHAFELQEKMQKMFQGFFLGKNASSQKPAEKTDNVNKIMHNTLRLLQYSFIKNPNHFIEMGVSAKRFKEFGISIGDLLELGVHPFQAESIGFSLEEIAKAIK